MKKVGIDGRLLYQTGVGVYIRNLLFYLNKFNPKNIDFIVYVLKKDCSNLSSEFKNLSFKGVSAKWHTFLEQVTFLSEILKDKLDLMHFTYFSFPIFYNKRYISTIHDTTLLNFKTGKASTKSPFIYDFKHIIFRHMFYRQVEKSKFIITPTESVKKQIMKLDSTVDPKKIKPIYEGITIEYLKVNKSKKSNSTKYFLYVGTFYPHKNVEALIKAYSKVITNIKLYLVGPDDFFSKRIENLIDSLSIRNKIKILKKVSQDRLPEFYKNAIALVHPSLSEGFGLPIIEAAYFGIPIIASDIDVFKEVLGNKYLAFNPKDVNDIKEKLEYFIFNKPHFDYQDLLQKFSFEKMTIETFKIYMDVLKIN